MRTLSVIIPCYNEAATIVEVVRRVQDAKLPEDWQKEITIVDDGSETKTVAILRTLEGSARIIHRKKNGGKGAAVKEGLRHATGEYCIIQDADLELDPNDYGALLYPIDSGESEVVFGYRTRRNTEGKVNPVLFYGGWILSFLFNTVFFTHFKDIPACYKIFPRSYIPALLKTPSNDFVFDSIEMTYVLSRGKRVVQVPIHYYPRTRVQGKKLRLEDGVKSAIAIIILRLGLHHFPIAKEVGRIARFFIAGATTTAVNISALYVLTEYVHIWYIASSIIAFCVSYGVNFTLQKFWTFRNTDQQAILRQMSLHLPLALLNLSLNTAILYALVEWVGIWYVLAQAIATLVIAAESFILSKRIFS